MAEPSPRDFEAHHVLGSRQISLAGDLDVATVGIMSEAVTAFLRTSPGPLTIDLTELTFIDAAGLGSLVGIRAAQTANRHVLLLVGSSPRVAWVFGLAGLRHLLDDPRLDVGLGAPQVATAGGSGR